MNCAVLRLSLPITFSNRPVTEERSSRLKRPVYMLNCADAGEASQVLEAFQGRLPQPLLAGAKGGAEGI